MVAKLTMLASTFAAMLVACSSFTESDPAADADAGVDGAVTDASEEQAMADSARDTAAPDGAQFSGCKGDQSCVRTVFVTKLTYTGYDIQSLEMGDALCTMAAMNSTNTNVKGRQFLAWLSTSAGSPSTRFVQGTMAYNLPDGTKVAGSWAAFRSDTHAAPIDEDENGLTVDELPVEAWTGTNDDGTLAMTNCGDWKLGSSLDMGENGLFTNDLSWSAASTAICTTPLHLYCVER